tara:strand:- start:6573 stop:6944 length:372 start_codon:yes stop_codon:yes gene_type:complete
MVLKSLCPPAIVYIVFTSVHVLVDIFDKNLKEAMLQLLVGIIITALLQYLCYIGLDIVSWIIVFVPFIFYTYMMVLLYNIFGLDRKKYPKPDKKGKKKIHHKHDHKHDHGDHDHKHDDNDNTN